MRCAIRFATIFSLLAAAGTAAAQEEASTLFRQKRLLVMAGQVINVDLGRLEAGRTYVLEIELANTTASSGEGWLEVGVGRMNPPIKHILRPESDRITLKLMPQAPGSPLRITGGGELGAVYDVWVRWRAMSLSRMPGITFIPAPHQNPRPSGASVTAIVVHATVSPTLDSTIKWFLAPESQVSAHYTIGKDGTIVQMVEDSQRAWHAGVSELDGLRGVNDFSIGIEIVNLNDGLDPYTDAQYGAVASIIRHIRAQFDVPDSRIVSHEFVARPPGRKSDPKGFDFQRLFRMLRD